MACLREKQHKTQEQVATTAGVTASMISNYERGKEKPSLDSLWKILTALNCTLIDLEAALRFVQGDHFPVHCENWRIILASDEYETGVTEPQSISDAEASLEKILGSGPIGPDIERGMGSILRGVLQLFPHSFGKPLPESKAKEPKTK